MSKNVFSTYVVLGTFERNESSSTIYGVDRTHFFPNKLRNALSTEKFLNTLVFSVVKVS